MVNQRTGKKQNYDYEEKEKEFQIAQEEWEKDSNNKLAWHKMFELINLACFNSINKKLEKVIPKEEIESKAIDVTLDIMESILSKKEEGKDWKINKVSSFVYLPCFAIYNKQLQFEEQTLGEDSYVPSSEKVEKEHSYVQGEGIYSERR